MPAARKKPLSEEKLAEARALRALFQAYSKTDGALSQELFGERYGLGTQGNVWQYLNGRMPLNVEAATKFAQGLGCSVADFSPALEAERKRLAAVTPAPDQMVHVPEKLPAHIAEDVLRYVAALSAAQQEILLTNLRNAAQANDVTKQFLKVPELKHPTDTSVAKALRVEPSRVDEDPEEAEFLRRQLPLFVAGRRGKG